MDKVHELVGDFGFAFEATWFFEFGDFAFDEVKSAGYSGQERKTLQPKIVFLLH